jgi:peptidoglycan-N-acetylglucosamine deacetylase
VPGSIIVFHDSLKASARMKYALPRVLDHFAEQGFKFRSIAY